MKMKERIKLLERISLVGNRETITRIYDGVCINTGLKMVEELKCCDLIELKYRKHKTYSHLTDKGRELLRDFNNREQKLNEIMKSCLK